MQSGTHPATHSDKWSVSTAIIITSAALILLLGVFYHFGHQGVL